MPDFALCWNLIELRFSFDVFSVTSLESGNHDFNLLKKLVLPDGSILRAKLPGRPTRDCLFSDPARDGKRLSACLICFTN
jgi:hypothetical protein